MNRITGWAAMSLAVACGMDEGTFVTSYLDAYCTFYLACSDPALEVFDGIDTHDECLAAFEADVVADLASCTLDPRAAKDCLDGLEGRACPAEGHDVDGNLPAECASVWTDCGDAEEER